MDTTKINYKNIIFEHNHSEIKHPWVEYCSLDDPILRINGKKYVCVEIFQRGDKIEKRSPSWKWVLKHDTRELHKFFTENSSFGIESFIGDPIYGGGLEHLEEAKKEGFEGLWIHVPKAGEDTTEAKKSFYYYFFEYFNAGIPIHPNERNEKWLPQNVRIKLRTL